MVEKQLYDVMVAGGGLSGIAAAAAAAREGAKVLLVERYGFLGGMAVAGLVNPFMPYWIWTGRWQTDPSQPVNGGIFRDILEDLDALGGLHTGRQTFNEEILKLALDRMVQRYGVKVLLHSMVTGVNRSGSRIHSITAANKSGSREYQAHYYVDATGDGDVSALAGCEFKLGREEDHQCQPMTLCFRLANVDKSRYDRELTNRKYREARRQGRIANPREDVLTFDHMVEDVLHFNSTRIIGKSAVDAEDMTRAEMEAREQVYELYQFMKENIPGFEECQLLMSAAQTGVRESRRIVGEYTITQEDLLSVRKFEDSVARGTYPVDIHNPSGSGTVLKDIPYGDYYTIPYRALIPRGMDNLIVAGRPISSTHEAHSAYRVMPICTCIGEGAGTAAAIAWGREVSFREVPVEVLHGKLDQYGVLY